MPDFWNNIKKLFTAAEESSPNQPVIHEMIERSAEELAGYERWKSGLGRRRMIDWLQAEYANYLIDPEQIDEAIDFLDTPSSKGFVIHFQKTRYPLQEVINLLDYLKEKVLAMNYRSYMSDVRTYNRPKWVESVQRHYLKPPTNLRQPINQKFNQKYGNITIELQLRNEQAFYLKFSATSYRDHLFKNAEDFAGLMRGVLKTD